MQLMFASLQASSSTQTSRPTEDADIRALPSRSGWRLEHEQAERVPRYVSFYRTTQYGREQFC
jgi:hypothetical protein